MKDIEKLSDRILIHLNDYQQLKDTITIQKKTINNMIAETYNNWLKDRRSAVTNNNFRYIMIFVLIKKKYLF